MKRTGEKMGQPAQNATRRSAGVVALAVALLAVLVLAGLGAAGSLKAGAELPRLTGGRERSNQSAVEHALGAEVRTFDDR